MDNATKHILLQLEMLLKEFPEAEFYIQEKVKGMISDLLNAEDHTRELHTEESEF